MHLYILTLELVIHPIWERVSGDVMNLRMLIYLEHHWVIWVDPKTKAKCPSKKQEWRGREAAKVWEIQKHTKEVPEPPGAAEANKGCPLRSLGNGSQPS